MPEPEEKAPLMELGGLWKNVTPRGKEYWSGKLGRLRLLIFENGYKKPGSKEPDAIMYVTMPKKEEREARAPRGEENQAPPPVRDPDSQEPPPDDLPF